MKKSLLRASSRSFTLVEVLVALFIILLVIGAASGIEVSYMRLGDSTRHTIQANSIAQEGLDLVKLIRDKNLTNNVNSFLGFPLSTDNSVQKLNDEVNPTGFISGEKTFQPDGPKGTVFHREIRICDPSVITCL